MLRKIIEIYSDQEFREKFDGETLALNTKHSMLVLAMISSVSFLLLLGSFSLDYYGYLPESIFLVAGILTVLWLAKKVSVARIQVFLTFGLAAVIFGTEIVSILNNGAGYVNRPYHPGIFHIFVILAVSRLRPVYALFSAFVNTAFLFLATDFVGLDSRMIVNVKVYLFLAASFGLIFGYIVYFEEWQTYAAHKKIAEIKKRSDNIISNILPAEVSEKLIVSRDQPHFYERGKVSVLVMDLVGYSEWVQHNDEQQLATTLTNLFSRLDNVVGRHHATKIKTLGDAYVVVTGLVQAENLENDCFLTAQAFNREIAEFNREFATSFQSRIGIGTGSAIFGVIGHNRPKFDIWGAALQTAQKMEKSCPINDIVLCPDTQKARLAA